MLTATYLGLADAKRKHDPTVRALIWSAISENRSPIMRRMNTRKATKARMTCATHIKSSYWASLRCCCLFAGAFTVRNMAGIWLGEHRIHGGHVKSSRHYRGMTATFRNYCNAHGKSTAEQASAATGKRRKLKSGNVLFAMVKKLGRPACLSQNQRNWQSCYVSSTACTTESAP